MKIEYKTKLEPINEEYLEEDDINSYGDRKLELQDYNTLKFKVRGEEVQIVSENDLTDLDDVLAVIGKNSSSAEYERIRYKARFAQKIKDKIYQCITVFEDKKEVIFLTLKNDKFEVVVPKDFRDASEIELESNTPIIYFIIKNEFTLMPLEFYTPKPRDILKLSNGFCELVTLRKGSIPKVIQGEDTVLYTPKKLKLSSKYLFQVDKRTVKTYTSQESEYTLLAPSEDIQSFEHFDFGDLKDNLVILYSYKDSELLFDRVLLAESMNTFNFVTNTESLELIDAEYKKSYFFKIYKTEVTIPTATIELLNDSLIKELELNQNIYQNKVYIASGI